MATPYTFEPVYPIQESIDLAKRIRTNPDDLVTHGKHVAGIVGCVLEKHDTEEVQQAYTAKPEIQEMRNEGDFVGLAETLENHLNSPQAVPHREQLLDGFSWYLIKTIASIIFNRLTN